MEVTFSNIPELMGAYGAALYARDNAKDSDKVLNLDELLDSQTYTSDFEVCPGCENKCTVRTFKFANGNTFYSGNNCEKIYSNSTLSAEKGVNQYQERYRLLFSRTFKKMDKEPLMKIGIPRGLIMYEHYPFWFTLLSECNIKPILSRTSTNSLYEKGIRSIMADNICFPAKLMHGHVMDLVEKGVDRILYPYTVFDKQESKKARNSYICPVVTGYSDVLKSSIDTEFHYNIPLDSPTVAFNDENLLAKSCVKYLMSLGVDKKVATRAFAKALEEQNRYVVTVAEENRHIVEQAKKNNRMVILLCGRPYHIDPLIQHKIANTISDMGIDVITENVALFSNEEVFNEVNAILVNKTSVWKKV